MKIFGYFDDVIAWQLGLEWYWSYGLMIVAVAIIYFGWLGFLRYLGVRRCQK